MGAIRFAIIVLAGLAVFCACSAEAARFGTGKARCNECHSKKPEIKTMHQALEFKDCGTCHGPGKGRPGAEIRKRMEAEPACAGCHGQTK